MAHGKSRSPLLHRRSEARPGARRSVVACNRCRNRKTRCAGTPPTPCPSCEDAGQLCVYSEAEKRVAIPESYLRMLQAQANTVPRLDEPSSASSSNSNQFSPDANVERGDWWLDDTDNLFLNRSGGHHFVGPSSATHLVKRLHPSSTNLAWDVRPLYDDPTSLLRNAKRALPQLPPYDFAKRLFWVHYTYIGTIFSLIQPSEFEERLDIVYHKPPDFSSTQSCLIYCQFLMVIAFGFMYSVNQWSGDDGPPGFKYFKHALNFLPDIHEEGSILFVDVLCYVAYYMQNLNRRDAAFLYVGLALRMAISLGLHQELSYPVSEAERNGRRRAWWSVYSLDRILSVKSGNPITIHDEDIGALLPGTMDGSTDVPWASVVLRHYAQLSSILGRVGEEIYRKKPRSGSNLLASMQSITNALSDWLRHVPNGLRIDFANLDTHLNRECVSISLHFYSCVNMTARPLVFYVIKRQLDAEAQGAAPEDWRDGLSQSAVGVIDSCITAARATTLILDAAAKHNRIATYGYLDGEYAFSAALLLVMVNAAFPYSATNSRSMDMALNILRGMADRGNAYLGSRHSLLLELQSVISPEARKEEAAATGLITPSNSNSQPQSLASAGTGGATAVGTPADWSGQHDLPSIEDISFNIDGNEDTGLWDQVLGQIDIDMDTDWIETTLRR